MDDDCTESADCIENNGIVTFTCSSGYSGDGMDKVLCK